MKYNYSTRSIAQIVRNLPNRIRKFWAANPRIGYSVGDLTDFLEKKRLDFIDDYQHGLIYIRTEKGGLYVINYNIPSNEGLKETMVEALNRLAALEERVGAGEGVPEVSIESLKFILQSYMPIKDIIVYKIEVNGKRIVAEGYDMFNPDLNYHFNRGMVESLERKMVLR